MVDGNMHEPDVVICDVCQYDRESLDGLGELLESG